VTRTAPLEPRAQIAVRALAHENGDRDRRTSGVVKHLEAERDALPRRAPARQGFHRRVAKVVQRLPVEDDVVDVVVRDLALRPAVGVHHVDLEVAVAVAREGDLLRPMNYHGKER
jgi:hypothetical protein